MNSEVWAVIAFGFIALLILLIGVRRNFFHFDQKPWIVPLNLFQLLGAFSIYFLTNLLVIVAIQKLLETVELRNYIGIVSFLSWASSTLVALLLAIYLWLLPKEVRQGIFRRPGTMHPLIQDVWAAFYAWIMAFPLVLFVSQGLEILITKLFNIPILPDQIAVRILKQTFDHPISFLMTVFSIVILAPLIEETLFRGFLQTFIRKHLGSKQAIIITSICFSLFHYANGQGLGNIMILISLSVLALFLGFIYEKQGSLLAPMVLHSLFNTISVFNLYMFGGFSSGI